MRWFLIVFWLFFICGCSESNGVDYMAPSPQNGFSTNKQVFAAKYSTSSKEWSAKQGALFTVPITVKNVSASAWSSHTEEHSVQMSYHWLDLKKNMLTFEGLRKVLEAPLVFKHKVKSLAAITLIAGLINIILNYFLIKIYGINGAAYATLISFLVLYIISFILVVKEIKLPWFLTEK